MRIQPIFLSLIIAFACITSTRAQTLKIASTYTKAFTETRDLKALMSVYADSVLMTDHIWGGQDMYTKDQISEMYKILLDPKSGVNYEILATAVDEKTNTIILRGNVTTSDQPTTDFTSCLVVKGGKIISQNDFINYPVADLRYSEKFKPHFLPETSNTQSFVEAFKAMDVDRFVSHYADTVVYIDPAYGSEDRFSREDLRMMFGEFFAAEDSYSIKFNTISNTAEGDHLMLMLEITDPQGIMNFYGGWFKFENGKITQQIDFSTYPVKDMLASPRFVKYFEKENLEVSKKGG